MMVFKEYAIFWIADTDEQAEQARLSAETARISTPQTHNVLFTTRDILTCDAFDAVEKLPERAYDSYTPDFVRYLGYSLEKIEQQYVIFAGNLANINKKAANLYSILQRFNMVGCQNDNITNAQFYVPECFFGFSIGARHILGLRNVPPTVTFVRDWWQMLDKYRGDYWTDPQISIREMLWQYSMYDKHFNYCSVPEACIGADL